MPKAGSWQKKTSITTADSSSSYNQYWKNNMSQCVDMKVFPFFQYKD